MHPNFMDALMVIAAGTFACLALGRPKLNLGFPKTKPTLLSLLLASAACLFTIFVASRERWDGVSVLTTLLFGLVLMFPFLIIVAATRLAATSKMQMAILVVTSMLFIGNVAMYGWAYFIAKDEDASLTILVVFPVNLLIALWLIVSLLWEPKECRETTT